MDSDLDWISHGELERLTGAHRTTVARWKRRARAGLAAPPWLVRLVNAVHRGHLGDLSAAWRGWLINPRDGQLVSPEGLCVTPGQVRALPQMYDLKRTLEGELLQLRATVKRLEMALAARAPAPIIPCGKSRRIRAAQDLAGARRPELVEA